MPEWFIAFYENTNSPRYNLRILLDEVGNLLTKRDFGIIDNILATCEMKRLQSEIIMAIMRSTSPAKDHLLHWNSALTRASAELEDRSLGNILTGLI